MTLKSIKRTLTVGKGPFFFLTGSLARYGAVPQADKGARSGTLAEGYRAAEQRWEGGLLLKIIHILYICLSLERKSL